MKKAIFTGVSVVIFLLSSIFSFAHAQAIGTTSIDGIDISSSPTNPAPGTNVTVTVDSYSTNLSGATIAWTINGKSFAKGTGMTSINTPAPATGKTLEVMATINTIEGATIQKIIPISSGDVDIVWESSGYVPPLYEGKVPFVYQGTVNVIAVPHLVDSDGNPIDPKNLIYQWKENTFVMGSQSGYGRQSFQVTGSVIAGPVKIDVTVASADASAHAEAEITLQPVAPSIVFYQDDPLYGVLYNSAINGTLRLVHNQTKVLAVPYGFSLADKGFVYNWSINGSTQSDLSKSKSVVLGVNSGQQGSSNIDLSIQNGANDILQGAEAAFTAVFANSSTGSANTNSSVF